MCRASRLPNPVEHCFGSGPGLEIKGFHVLRAFCRAEGFSWSLNVLRRGLKKTYMTVSGQKSNWHLTWNRRIRSTILFSWIPLIFSSLRSTFWTLKNKATSLKRCPIAMGVAPHLNLSFIMPILYELLLWAQGQTALANSYSWLPTGNATALPKCSHDIIHLPLFLTTLSLTNQTLFFVSLHCFSKYSDFENFMDSPAKIVNIIQENVNRKVF
jgi:hypothetical protein